MAGIFSRLNGGGNVKMLERFWLGIKFFWRYIMIHQKVSHPPSKRPFLLN